MGQTTSFFPTGVSQTQNLDTDFEPERIIYTPLDSTGTRFLVLSWVLRPVTLLWRWPQWLSGLKLSCHGSTPQEWIPRQTAAGGVGYTGRGILEVKTVNELAHSYMIPFSKVRSIYSLHIPISSYGNIYFPGISSDHSAKQMPLRQPPSPPLGTICRT